MNPTALAIATHLANLETSSEFASHFFMEYDPELDVADVGRIALPVDIHTAHRLCAIAHPASYGYKDETRLDPGVRDTWEIPAPKLQFKNPAWPTLLEDAVKRISQDLGLAPSGLLRAELHNLLVYGPGQFFATHQDSEKQEGMIGTLVITLPSEFSGGEFIVSHQGEEIESRGSENRLGFMAFYADCIHEVRPVKQGYRVVLTYNLVMPDPIRTAEPHSEAVTALAHAITNFWHTPVKNRWRAHEPGQVPDRLVYLLDHEYTQASLSWKRLKGADVTRVGALRKVADALDAEIFLALADVQETWTAEEDYTAYKMRRGYRYYDEDDDGASSGNEPEPGELIDDSITLQHWINTDDTVMALRDSRVDDDELCYTIATKDCIPFESEYEGYTGNAGNTIDRWYHRAAVIMWPRSRAFALRARTAPAWAIEQIAAALRDNQLGLAREQTAMLLPFWTQAVRHSQDPYGNGGAVDNAISLLDLSLPVAVGLNDLLIAEKLLDPFVLTDLHPESAPWFAKLLEQHGSPWIQGRLQHWQKNPHYQSPQTKLTWLANTLIPLAQALQKTGLADASTVAANILLEHWNELKANLDRQTESLFHRVEQQTWDPWARALRALLETSHLVQSPHVEQEMIAALTSPAWPLQLALDLLHAVSTGTTESRKCLSSVYRHCVNMLSSTLEQPERKPDDWSIVPPKGCNPTLARFLQSADQKRLEWPLAKEGRQTIHRFIDAHKLPVTHETRRTGRPFTLVLEKTNALFERAKEERSHWENELAWLHKTARNFNQG